MKLIETKKEITGYQVWPEVTSRLWEAQEKYSIVYMLYRLGDAQVTLQTTLNNKLVSLYAANVITAEQVGGPIGYMGGAGPRGLPGNIDFKDPSQNYKHVSKELKSLLDNQRELNIKVNSLIELMGSK